MGFLDWLMKTWAERRWGDVLSVVSVLFSLIGFSITIWQVVKSRKAAKMAAEAALKVRDTIQRYDTIEKFSAAITTMEEIKRLHRAAAWSALPDRYATLRGLLISIRSSTAHLSSPHQAALQSAIQHFRDIEKKVERALATQSTPSNVAKLNEIVSSQVDNLYEVLGAIRKNIGVEEYGGQKTSNLSSKVERENP